ncbi:MAG: hypothetical protein IJ416_03255 [Ruminiclostridium sp.]|nr:hypothetical protein [Ruminiclostridium sp.]
MQEYFDKDCALCGEKMKDGDDIAVCPHCGTPVHRACWKGRCPNEERHAEGYDWDKDNSGSEEKEERKEPSDLCSVCGMPVDDRPVYCPDCGEPMHMACFLKARECPNKANHDGSYYDEENLRNDDGSPKIFINSYDSFADRVIKHPIKDKDTGEPLTCFGVTQTELVHFLGKEYLSTPRYMGIFIRMAMTGKKAFFNLWAGLLTPYYQYYQKMIGPATILLLANVILGIPQLMFQMKYYANATTGNEMLLDAHLAGIINVLSFVMLIIQILLAFFGDYLYMRWTVNKILTLREKYKDLPEAEYYGILERKGNPKWYYTLVGLGFTLAAYYVLSLFLM